MRGFAAALVVATLLSACGGSSSPSSSPSRNAPSSSASAPVGGGGTLSDQAYDQALAAAEQKVTTAESAARSKAKAKTPISVVTPLLTSWAAAMDSAADDLSSITPPTKATTANQHLVTALHDFATELRSAVDSIEKSKKPWLKVLSGIMQGAKGPTELEAAVKELNGLGYSTHPAGG
ncbi:MAG: hypothetical protein ABR579_01130 [Actinomycetota bacterium]